MTATVPFYQKDDWTWSLSDMDLTVLFNKIVDQHALKVFFYDGAIRDAVDFINYVKNPQNRLFLGFKDGELFMITVLNTITQRRAQGHFCSVRSDKKIDLKTAGREMLIDILSIANKDGVPYFDVFYGIVPTTNKLAIRFAQMCGMKKGCVIPKFCFNYFEQKITDGQILYIVREEQDEDLQ